MPLIRFGLFIHQAGTFGVNVLSVIKLMFADSGTGKFLTPKDLIKLGSLSYRSMYFG